MPRRKSSKVSFKKASKSSTYVRRPYRRYAKTRIIAPPRTPAITPMVPAPSTPFRDAGGEIGGFFGFPKLGSMAGSAIGRLFGSGAYKLAYTPTTNSIISEAVPEFGMAHGQANSIRIRHREYLCDITSSTAFSTQSFPINVGLNQTFPWLSEIASSFTTYKIHGLVAVFKSTCADAVSSTNGSIGSVIMSFNDNVTESAFSSKQTQLECDWACDEKPSVSFVAPLECAPAQQPLKELYIRNTSLQTNQNLQFYDMANLQVSTQGQQAVFTCGELYLSYDITLSKPAVSVLANGQYYHLQMAGIPSTSLYFGTITATPTGATNMQCTITATTLTFPSTVSSGRFMMILTYTGGSASLLVPTITLTSGATALNIFSANTSAQRDNNALTSTQLFVATAFTITAPSAVITLSGGTLPTTISSGDVIITSIPVQGTQ